MQNEDILSMTYGAWTGVWAYLQGLMSCPKQHGSALIPMQSKVR